MIVGNLQTCAFFILINLQKNHLECGYLFVMRLYLYWNVQNTHLQIMSVLVP